MRIFRNRRPSPIAEPEALWNNPFSVVAVDTATLLERLDITMLSGELKSAVLRTAEHVQPVVAKRVAFDALSRWCITQRSYTCQQLERVQMYIEQLIPLEVTDDAEKQFDAHGDTFRYSKFLINANDDDPELAIKAGKQVVADFVTASYEATCTPDVQSDLAHDFENWQANN